MTVTIEHEIRP